MTDKYGIKEYLEEYRQALEQQPEQAKPQAQPNVLERLKAKAGLNRTRNERQSS